MNKTTSVLAIVFYKGQPQGIPTYISFDNIDVFTSWYSDPETSNTVQTIQLMTVDHYGKA